MYNCYMSKSKKISSTKWRYISIVFILLLAVPVITLTYYLGFPGRIIGYVAYFGIGALAIFETTKAMGISIWSAMYLSALLVVTFVIPVNFDLIKDGLGGNDAQGTFKEIFTWKNTTSVLIGTLGIFIWEKELRSSAEVFFKNLIMFFFIMSVIPIFAKSFYFLNMLDYKYILFFLPIAIISDSFGYLGGKYLRQYIFKGKKLAPKISPKKTWAGAIIGYVPAVVCTVLLGYYLHIWKSVSPDNELILSIVIGFVLPIISPIGDLMFSSIKREKDIKDFSNLIPGHGGLMDRLDSAALILFVIALIFII